MNYKLQNMSEHEIQTFMLENNLLNMADMGRKLGISRERVRQIFNSKKIKFSEFKKSITIALNQKDISLPKEKWLLIDFYDTAHKYYISNFGRVARSLNKKINGTIFEQKKILKPSSGKCERLRVNLTIKINDEKNKHITYYIHSLVAMAFKKVEGKKFRIRHLDNDYTNNHVNNLEVKYPKEKTKK